MLSQLILEGVVYSHYEALVFLGGLSSEVLCKRSIGTILLATWTNLYIPISVTFIERETASYNYTARGHHFPVVLLLLFFILHTDPCAWCHLCV